MLLIGSTGEVYPAASIPRLAAARGAAIIEINPEPSSFSGSVAALRLPLPAGRGAGPARRRCLDRPGSGA